MKYIANIFSKGGVGIIVIATVLTCTAVVAQASLFFTNSNGNTNDDGVITKKMVAATEVAAADGPISAWKKFVDGKQQQRRNLSSLFESRSRRIVGSTDSTRMLEENEEEEIMNHIRSNNKRGKNSNSGKKKAKQEKSSKKKKTKHHKLSKKNVKKNGKTSKKVSKKEKLNHPYHYDDYEIDTDIMAAEECIADFSKSRGVMIGDPEDFFSGNINVENELVKLHSSCAYDDGSIDSVCDDAAASMYECIYEIFYDNGDDFFGNYCITDYEPDFLFGCVKSFANNYDDVSFDGIMNCSVNIFDVVRGKCPVTMNDFDESDISNDANDPSSCFALDQCTETVWHVYECLFDVFGFVDDSGSFEATQLFPLFPFDDLLNSIYDGSAADIEYVTNEFENWKNNSGIVLDEELEEYIQCLMSDPYDSYNDDYNYWNPIKEKECSVDLPCPDEYFCNFDFYIIGFCEECSSESICYDDNLSPKGAEACQFVCFP